ncbi:MAG: Eco57I restriction-modification methylase domain-containing protein [Anaerolineae bacterium]
MQYTFTQQSLEIGQTILASRALLSRKEFGQFLTPLPLARYMAQQLGPIRTGDCLLDPAMGSGTLLCAVIERLIEANQPTEIWIDGFEVDGELLAAASAILSALVNYAAEYGIQVHLNTFQADYLLNGLHHLRPSLLESTVGRSHYQRIIANPPYFKIKPTDVRRHMSESLLSGQTNIYTLFMALAIRMLHNGTACFLVPRSFCSGEYFTHFRRDLVDRVSIRRIHLFEARDDAFGTDKVLQENVLISFTAPRADDLQDSLEISASATLDDLSRGTIARTISRRQFISPQGLFRLPTSDLDDAILQVVDSWTGSLNAYGMAISTGPVVPFRAEAYLQIEADGDSHVPLLWMQHVKAQEVTWPLHHPFRKPQFIISSAATKPLLVRNANYVLLRRFSAKEEQRRLIAAPFLAYRFAYSLIGLENHLNYVHRSTTDLSVEEAVGLSALFNSGLIDRYVRISNGNTQVNAAELRDLPLPPQQAIINIGQVVLNAANNADLDALVIQLLQELGLIPSNFPVLRETRSA